MEIKHSVLIVTFNHEQYIRQCLDSVVNQSCLPFEIIISDDHSNDKTWDIIKTYKSKHQNLFHIYRNEKNVISSTMLLNHQFTQKI